MEQLAIEAPRWQETGGLVLAINNGDSEQMLALATRVGANFPILTQKQWELTQLFQVNATPWGFAISSTGMVTSSGMMGTPEQLSALLEATGSLTPIY